MTRATCWRLRNATLHFDALPRLMGIVNVTPDSFSDGGKFQSADQAVQHGLQLAAEGADILDVGGESTRPYADPVAAEEELRRVIPVVTALARETEVPISIDTSKAVVARQALDAGAQIINDVTGLTGDAAMLEVALESSAGVCVMHMQGTPQTMQDAPVYHDVVRDIAAYLAERRDALLDAGIERERICLDPGIGFGKNYQHNLTLMAHCWQFLDLRCPVLVGHSRKGFLGKLLGDSDRDRLQATVGAALALARQGVPILRVHEVRPVNDALVAFAAAGGIDDRPSPLA